MQFPWRKKPALNIVKQIPTFQYFIPFANQRLKAKSKRRGDVVSGITFSMGVQKNLLL
jgi:hypothetical protein